MTTCTPSALAPSDESVAKRLGLSVALLALALALAGCDQTVPSEGTSQEETSRASGEAAEDSAMTIEETLDKHTEDLLAISGVEGVGQGECGDRPCIVVYVFEKAPEVERAVPDTLEGYSVNLVETGGIEAQ